MRVSRGDQRSAWTMLAAVAALALSLCCVLIVLAGQASAATARTSITSTRTTTPTAPPPPNDSRDNAQSLGALPAKASGTTVGSTLEANEPSSDCGRLAGSVWYSVSFGATPPGTVGVRLAAGGQLDACADVFIKQRSQDIPVTGASTDANGLARLTFTPTAGTTYLIRIGQLRNSDPGPFTLTTFGVAASASAPGAALPRNGGRGDLDSFFTTSAAYSTQLTAAVTYKLNLVNPAGGCMHLSIYGPGTTDFGSASPVSRSCSGYRLFTPMKTGRYSLLIGAADGVDAEQPFALHVAPASSREMAPGVALENLSTARGLLRGNVDDVVRLYRIDVTSHSQLTLSLHDDADFDLVLLDNRGRELSCACGDSGGESLQTVTRAGTYYAAVRAENFTSGRFTLRRQSRTITGLRVRINGAGAITVTPGTSGRVSAQIGPAVTGAVHFELEYFDPLSGWQFRGMTSAPLRGGVAAYSFTPPDLGRWRVTASFNGTSIAAPASSGWAEMLVADPVGQ